MFGYVRPHKTELKIKDFTWYRAIYCGLCKTLKREYDELPRLATNYDLTFMALLILAFHDDAPAMRPERCIANPIRKHGITEAHPVLDFTAATAVLLAAHKLLDNVVDKDKAFLNQTALLVFRGSIKKARLNYPELAAAIDAGMTETSALERDSMNGGHIGSVTAPQRFGRMLADIFELGLGTEAVDNISMTAIKLTAVDLGSWIYYLDALDDYQDDLKKGAYNALTSISDIVLDESDIQGYGQTVGFAALKNKDNAESHACKTCQGANLNEDSEFVVNIAPEDISREEWLFMKAAAALQSLESSIDRQFAFLTYKRFGDLVANIVCEGLFDMRMTILRGQNPGRL